AMVLRRVGWMALIGGIAGLVAAVALGRAAQALLFGLSGQDPWVLVAAVMLLSLIVFVAGYMPARPASKIPPMEALPDHGGRVSSIQTESSSERSAIKSKRILGSYLHSV